MVKAVVTEGCGTHRSQSGGFIKVALGKILKLLVSRGLSNCD
jgi:hypothetical protein